METKWYSVNIEVWADRPSHPDPGDELLSLLVDFGAVGSVVHSGDHGVGALFSLEVQAGEDAEVTAVQTGRALFLNVLDKAGIHHAGVRRLEVMDERYQEIESNRPTEAYLGVAEVAALLGVTKQRISELRTRQGFPAPIAELASGPVWKESSLRRFADSWERRPGRPRKAAVGSA